MARPAALGRGVEEDEKWAGTMAMAAVRASVDPTDAAEMDRFLVRYKKLTEKFRRAPRAE